MKSVKTQTRSINQLILHVSHFMKVMKVIKEQKTKRIAFNGQNIPWTHG